LIADTGKLVDDDAVRRVVDRSPVHRADGRQWPLFELVSRSLVDRWLHE
jgi:hypothetical protein